LIDALRYDCRALLAAAALHEHGFSP
jgi:hypothetical protein